MKDYFYLPKEMLRLLITKLGMIAEAPFQDKEKAISYLSPMPQDIKTKDGWVAIDSNSKILIQGTPIDISTYPPLFKGIKTDYMLEPEWGPEEYKIKIFEWFILRNKELGITPFIQETNIEYLQNEKGSENIDWNKDSFSFCPTEAHRRQAYILIINKQKIELIAESRIGWFYGIQTLLQLMFPPSHSLQKRNIDFDNSSSMVVLPEIEIKDYPTYLIRGLVDDISRGQRPTIENFERFIRFLGKNKQNYLVLYIEDMFEWPNHPNIGKTRGRLTAKDIRHLQDYAKDWGVTIIPAVELLGHMENILMDPEYMDLGEFPSAQCIDITNEKAREFIRELIQGIAPLFDVSLFAPICDESFDFGTGRSKPYIDKVGWGEALAEWYLFLIDEIHKAGKDLVLFAHDIMYKSSVVMERIKDKPAIVYYWDYADKKKYPIITKLKNHGLTVVGGPAVFDWSRHFPYFDFAEKNTIYMAKDGLKRGLVGLVTTKWGDFFNENFRNNIFYGLAVNGQAAWSPMKSNVSQIRNAFGWLFFGTQNHRIINIMDILSKQNINLPRWPNGMFNRFWLDPFVRKIKKKEYEDALKFIKEANFILKEINELREGKIIKNNLDILDYFEYAARMAKHYGAKILISESAYHKNNIWIDLALKLLSDDISSIVNNNHFNPNDYNIVEKLIYGFKFLVNDIDELSGLYPKLWKKLAVPEGLEYPIRRFEVLKWHYNLAIESLQNSDKGDWPHAHQLSSEWIWRSGKRMSIHWGNRTWYIFKKSFYLNLESKLIKKIFIQGIAGNHCRIYLNERFIGEVLSRFSLGQLPMAKAVQFYDLSKENILRNGENTIFVQAINWGNGLGMFNLILHIEFEDNSILEIKSDDSWEWNELDFGNIEFSKLPWHPDLKTNIKNPNKWLTVRSYGPAPCAWQGPITEPNWDEKWKSSISFIFGNRNFIETALAIQLGPNVYKTLFWLVPPGARLFSEDMYLNRCPKK